MVIFIDIGLLAIIFIVMFISGVSAARRIIPFLRIATWIGIILSIIILAVVTIKNEVLSIPQKIGCIIANIAGNLIIAKLVMDVIGEVSATRGDFFGTLLAGAEIIFGTIIVAAVSAFIMFCIAALMGHNDEEASVPFWGKFLGVAASLVLVCIIFR